LIIDFFEKEWTMQKKRIVLNYPQHLVDQPVISKLVKDYDLSVNIMRARITPKEEGRLVLELTGKRAGMEAGFKYLSEIGVEIQPLAQDVKWHEDRCTHCTACISVCPTNGTSALPVNCAFQSVLIRPWKSSFKRGTHKRELMIEEKGSCCNEWRG
jgi:ferredoxin